MPFPSSEPPNFQCIIFIISFRKRLSGVKDHLLRKESCGSNGVQPGMLLTILSLHVCLSAVQLLLFAPSCLIAVNLSSHPKAQAVFQEKAFLPSSHPGLRGGQPCHGSCSSGLSSPRAGNRSTKLEDPATESPCVCEPGIEPETK